MAFDPKDLEQLASVLLTSGAPILAKIVGGVIGGPIGAIVGGMVGDLVPQIAQAFGLPADASVPQVTQTVQADPNAGGKLAALEDKHKLDLTLAQIQADQNAAALAVTTASWRDAAVKFYFAGWRAFVAWEIGVAIGVTLIATAQGWTPPQAFLAILSGLTGSVFLVLIGARTTDKIFGVGTFDLKTAGASIVRATRKITK